MEKKTYFLMIRLPKSMEISLKEKVSELNIPLADYIRDLLKKEGINDGQKYIERQT